MLQEVKASGQDTVAGTGESDDEDSEVIDEAA